MKTLKIFFDSGGLDLEACLDLPGGPGPHPGVVLCHPHPLYGGNMDNNVILAVSRALGEAGIAGMRFNFRGVGRSGGAYDNGAGEREDARFALDFLSGREEIDPARIGVMGYSFGGMVAMAAAERAGQVRAVAAVSPVIPPGGALREFPKPKFIACGAADDLIPSSAILEEFAKMAEPKKIEVVPGADHFWRGHEDKVAGMAARFFVEAFKS
ncbi:MAG: alpha/beta fold hydrolase [Peptococcaceae bacterium]|nr:alpha/beta fold hydrolase [Peptococcaceae bacterium]